MTERAQLVAQVLKLGLAQSPSELTLYTHADLRRAIESCQEEDTKHNGATRAEFQYQQPQAHTSPFEQNAWSTWQAAGLTSSGWPPETHGSRVHAQLGIEPPKTPSPPEAPKQATPPPSSDEEKQEEEPVELMVNMKHKGTAATPFDQHYERFKHISSGRHVKQEAFVTLQNNLKSMGQNIKDHLDAEDIAIIKETMANYKTFGTESHKTLASLYGSMKTIIDAKKEAFKTMVQGMDQKQANFILRKLNKNLKTHHEKLSECAEILKNLGSAKVAK